MSKINLYLKYLNIFFEKFDYKIKEWHKVKLEDLDKMEKTKLWNLFKSSYNYMKDDMIRRNSFKKFFDDHEKSIFLITDVDGDQKMDSFIIYKEKMIDGQNYKKISILGSNSKAKSHVIAKMTELLKKNNFFIESSLKINSIMDKFKMPKVNDESLVKKIIKEFSNKDIEYLGDGTYRRKLTNTGKTIEKTMYGNIS